MASHWYVIHVYSGFEKKVASAIREQAGQKGLGERFEEILVPTEEVVEVKRGAKVTLIDREGPGRGCSFGNSASLSSGSVAPLAMPGVVKSAPFQMRRSQESTE